VRVELEAGIEQARVEHAAGTAGGVPGIGHGVMNHAKLASFLHAALLLGIIAGSALSPAVAEEAAAPAIHRLSASDLEAFLDPLVNGQLGRLKIAGAVVVVVKDDGILFAKGYGYRIAA
jgi:hypothetical protein